MEDGSKGLCFVYNILLERVRKIEYYEYNITTSKNINQCSSGKISLNKTASTSLKGGQQFRGEILFPDIFILFIYGTGVLI